MQDRTVCEVLVLQFKIHVVQYVMQPNTGDKFCQENERELSSFELAFEISI